MRTRRCGTSLRRGQQVVRLPGSLQQRSRRAPAAGRCRAPKAVVFPLRSRVEGLLRHLGDVHVKQPPRRAPL